MLQREDTYCKLQLELKLRKRLLRLLTVRLGSVVGLLNEYVGGAEPRAAYAYPTTAPTTQRSEDLSHGLHNPLCQSAAIGRMDWWGNWVLDQDLAQGSALGVTLLLVTDHPTVVVRPASRPPHDCYRISKDEIRVLDEGFSVAKDWRGHGRLDAVKTQSKTRRKCVGSLSGYTVGLSYSSSKKNQRSLHSPAVYSRIILKTRSTRYMRIVPGSPSLPVPKTYTVDAARVPFTGTLPVYGCKVNPRKQGAPMSPSMSLNKALSK
ncbi:hypothetical protein EDB84DRAFT_1679984, partial [Lactarius hengduanensis]